MKTFYIAVLLLFIQNNIQAQTYTIDPNDTLSMTLAMNTYTDLNINLNKMFVNDTITLGYEVVYNDMPATWDQLLCVYGLCVGSNFPAGTSGLMNPLTGGNRGFVKLTINPMSLDQSATFRIYVYDENAPTQGDTLTFVLNSLTPIHSIENDFSITAYPNPATDFVVVESTNEVIRGVDIYDLNGTLVQSYPSLADRTALLDVDDLIPGIYCMIIQSGNHVFYNQKLIIK